jgi:MFS family permease
MTCDIMNIITTKFKVFHYDLVLILFIEIIVFFNDSLQNESLCLDYVHTLPNNETVPVCGWDHDGSTGILYQVLAGPVFNNLYPLAGIIMGILADKFNRKILLGLSLLFWSVATGLTGFSQYYWMLVVFRMLLAIGAAGCTPFAVSLIADYFPQELRGTALGIYYWGIYIGYSFSYALGNQINIALNWRWVFFISGLMGIALVPLVLFTVKEPSRADKDEKKEEPIYRAKNCGEFLLKLKESGKKILSKEFAIKQLKLVLLLLKTLFLPGMLTLIIAGAIRNAGGYVWAYNTQPFFSTFVSDDIISIYMTAIPLVGGCIGSIVGGIISDTLVKNRGTYARIWVLIFSQVSSHSCYHNHYDNCT